MRRDDKLSVKYLTKWTEQVSLKTVLTNMRFIDHSKVTADRKLDALGFITQNLARYNDKVTEADESMSKLAPRQKDDRKESDAAPIIRDPMNSFTREFNTSEHHHHHHHHHLLSETSVIRMPRIRTGMHSHNRTKST